jgi:hypothetical protein
MAALHRVLDSTSCSVIALTASHACQSQMAVEGITML